MNNEILVAALAPIVSRVVTSHCWVKHDGKMSHTRRALTDDKLAHHVNGGPAYGAAQIEPGASTTKIACLDLDSHGGETPWSEMQETGLRIMSACEGMGFSPIPFRSSGGRGMHIYFLWDSPQDAYSVRYGLRAVLDICGLRSGVAGVSRGEVEVFPKQNSVPADGFGNMFVLPLADASVPLDTFELDDMPKEYAAEMEWPISNPVPVVEREQPVVPVVGEMPVELDQLRSALDMIPNSGDQELDYDEWRNVMFALHHATGGSPDGLALAHEFSARSSKYAPDFLDGRVWPHIKQSHDGERGAITGRTILKLAREHGWQEPIEDDFEAIEPSEDSASAPPLPKFQRNKNGEILATVENVHMALLDPWVTGIEIAYDRFRDELMLTARGVAEWRAFTDPDYMRLRITLEKGGFKPIGREMIRDAVALIGDENRFDSAVLWLSRLRWDGVPRCAGFLQAYFGAADSPYTRAVSLYLWSALAGRVMSPGVKADMVPVLVGPQGLGKSEGIAAMVPSEDHFVEVALDAHDDSMARKMRGVLIGEIAELRGLQTREIEAVKAFITRRHEKWVPKFKEFAITYPRRLVFMGTSNPEEILADETGNRRWLPTKVSTVDREGIARDRLQLWAEARELFGANGVMWRDAQSLAEPEHAAFMVNDAWAHSIETWLDESEFGEENRRRYEPIRIHDALVGALRFNARDILQVHEKRVGRILTAMGFQRVTRRVGGKLAKVWVDPRHEGGEDLI